MPGADVLIVGAGLAGLNCARRLHRAGVSFKIIEASDQVGGRVRTDEVDGFLLDRGFQVFLTAYPDAGEALDLEALNLKPFYSGALVRYDGAFHRIADPTRHPLDASGALFSPLLRFSDTLKAARLRSALLDGSLDELFARPETTTLDALNRRWKFSEALIDRFFRPFLGGVMFDRTLKSSSRMAEFVLRMFLQGETAVPAAGMGAIPAQLAAGLPEQSILLNATVTAVEPGKVTLENGKTLTGSGVVVATEAPEAMSLLGKEPPEPPRSVACLYFSAPRPPVEDPVLVLNGEDGKGPVNNLAVLSNVAPSYAPPGAALLSIAVLGNPLQSDSQLEAEVRTQMTDWFGPQVADWRRLRTYRILYALPDQAPPFLSPPERPVRLQPGLYLCGDHRRTASINGALVSGRHAAEAVLHDLAHPAS